MDVRLLDLVAKKLNGGETKGASAKLAQRMDVGDMTAWRWLNGESEPVEYFDKLAKVLDLSHDQLRDLLPKKKEKPFVEPAPPQPIPNQPIVLEMNIDPRLVKRIKIFIE